MCGCGRGCSDGCCGGGFDGYEGGYEVMPGEMHGEPVPAVPQAPAAAATRVYRSQAKTRPIVAPKGQVARKSAPTGRSQYTAAPASAQVEVVRKASAEPRTLNVDDHAAALDPFGDREVAAPQVRPTASKAPAHSLPANPLR